MHIPEVLPAQTMAEACVPHPDALSLSAAVGVGAERLRTTLDRRGGQPPEKIRLFARPEGGLTTQEVDRARKVGIPPVSLGPRLLWTETAGLVAISAILYAPGELDQGCRGL